MGRHGSIFRKKRFPLIRWIAFALLCAIALTGVYTAIDNGRIAVRSQRILVWDLPKDLEGFTVLLISDMGGQTFGPNQKQIYNALKGKKYSAVCIAGNMLGPQGDTAPLLALLSALDPTKPVFFIGGEGDPAPVSSQGGGLVTTLSNWVSELAKKGAIYLDAPASMTVGKSTVWFSDAAQITLDLDSAADAYERAGLTGGDYYPDVIGRTSAARAQMQEADLSIILSSYPLRAETIYRMQEMNDSKGIGFLRQADVILSGGTAGGGWRIPYLGPLWADTWLPDDQYTKGYHYAGSLPQYITGGLHVNKKSPLPGFRLFNTPEVALLTFTSVIADDALPQ